MVLKDKIKVLIVDDSAFMRKVISDILESDSMIEVIGTARNGEDALKKIESLQPDVITLDVEMPVLDGIATLKEIMNRYPLPVVMLSSLTHHGANQTIKALELGAFDFIGKPSGPISLDIHKVKDELLEKVKMAANSKGKIRLSKQYKSLNKYNNTKIIHTNDSKHINSIVAIGTSTGGPRALQTVLTKLPSDIPAPIVIVQHMPAGFTKSLAERLDSICEIKVVEASDNIELENGYAYIAPGGYQMSVIKSNNKYILITDKNAAALSGHKPSVDYLFNSIAELHIENILAVIMTGMGGDGSKGLSAIKQRKSYAIAEDESTCVVFGMPRVAIQTGLVDSILPGDQIAEQIITYIRS